MMRKHFAWMISLPVAVQCGDVLWSGIFNSSASVADFDECALDVAIFSLISPDNAIRRVLVQPDCTLAVVHSRYWEYL